MRSFPLNPVVSLCLYVSLVVAAGAEDEPAFERAKREITAAIERGSASVASGVDLSAEAGMALEEITSASQDSGTRINGIVLALREQAKKKGVAIPK